MKQIILNITTDIIIIKCTNDDETGKVKVITEFEDGDNEFIGKLEALIQEHYGN